MHPLLRRPISLIVLWLVLWLVVLVAGPRGQQAPGPKGASQDDTFRFLSGIDLVNVTTTVADANGRFVPGLRKEDFLVYDDDRLVEITHFSAEQVPVSLGIVIDTSGSMAGDKIRAAQAALERFAFELLGPDDELFIYQFNNTPALLQGWTRDRRLVSRALSRLSASGGTALFDAVIEAVPLAARGRYQKKALLVISDGNDTSSRAHIRDVKRDIRESELLVYAIGIDGNPDPVRRAVPLPPPRRPIPFPPPFPPGGRRFPALGPAPRPGGQGTTWFGQRGDDRVNVATLRDMTDESGGRTEIIRHVRDLDPATAGVADELSKQYHLGYPSSGTKDGRWHTIRVELRTGAFRVRARRGYLAN